MCCRCWKGSAGPTSFSGQWEADRSFFSSRLVDASLASPASPPSSPLVLPLVLERLDQRRQIGNLGPAGTLDNHPPIAVEAVEADRHGRPGEMVGRRSDAADAEGAEHVHLPDRGRIARYVGDAVLGAGGIWGRRR